MKAVLTNTVALNGGDAAIMLAIMRALDACAGRSIEWVVCDGHPTVASRYYPGITFVPTAHAAVTRAAAAALRGPLIRLEKPMMQRAVPAVMRGARYRPVRRLLPAAAADVVAAYDSADLVVSTGGTYLVEHYDLAPRIRELQLIQRLGRPLILYTQSLGPLRDPDNRRQLAAVCDYARVILVRDAPSRRHVLELGISPDRCRVVPDCAFGLYQQPNGTERRPSDAPLAVAISVRAWRHFQRARADDGMRRYREAVGGLIAHLVRVYGARVTLISTCQGIPEYWADDSAVGVEIRDALPPDVAPSVLVDRAFHSPVALLDVLRGYDLAVATRMHFSILALMAHVPVIAVAYEFKTTELFHDLGLADLVTDIEAVDAPHLCAMADRALGRRDALVDHLRRVLPEQRAAALTAARLALDAVR